jgi:hypothetical protein
MEESKTPETDKCVEDNKHLKFLQESNWVDRGMVTIENPIVDLCRRLERERDEARAERDILRLDAQREAEQHDRMVSELEKVYAERDEAREDADHWKIEYEIVEARLRGVKHERDNGIVSEKEIIPKLRKLVERAIDDLGWFSETASQRLQEELNQIKEGGK